MKRYLLNLLIIVLLANSVLPVFAPYDHSDHKKNFNYKELSRILGSKVIICTNSNASKHYFSSFERLDQEQKQKLKKSIDLASPVPNNHDQKYINEVYSIYISALQNGSIRISEIAIKTKDHYLSTKSSRAPPLFS